MPYKYTFALRIPFHFLHHWCNTCTNHITNDMIHFISSCDVLVHQSWLHLLFTVAFVHGTKSCSSFTATRSIAPKPPTCPSRLQPVHQAKPHLDLLHLVTWLHVMSHMQWAPLSHNYLWTNHLCISLKHILVQLGCHSITKTKQGPFTSTPLNFPSLSISLFSKYHKSSSY